ncbi:MAG: SDR family NAD(P)-dependent oxidoreductase [Chthoniobacterales bacterium]
MIFYDFHQSNFMWTIDFSNLRVLITGATRGIGLGIATEFARAGAKVAGCSREPEDSSVAEDFRKAVTDCGGEAFYTQCDMADAEAPAALVGTVADAFDGIDVVISNAGQNMFFAVDACEEKGWSDCMNLDLASHWRLAKAAKPWLKQSGKSVFIVISSNHAHSTLPGCFPYNVAKAGLGAMVQSLAIEWGPCIRAIGVAPGFIDTPGNDVWFDSFSDPEAIRNHTNKMHPVGRIGTPAEIGALCVFLSSHHAGFISGTTILADGGRSALLQDSPKNTTL